MMGPRDHGMYSVTKRLEFCYGHRLMDYEGDCRHPHGHNAVAEIEVAPATLDGQGMVCDFREITDAVGRWVDRELDHKMILRRDDPLVESLGALGEPVFLVETNPTAECLARVIHEQAEAAGLAVTRVTVWETPTSSATYTA